VAGGARPARRAGRGAGATGRGGGKTGGIGHAATARAGGTRWAADRGGRHATAATVTFAKRASQYELGEPPFQVQDWYELNHNLFKALKTQKWVLGFVLVIIIVVALVNLVSSMVMLVTDKTREIAILKAMGGTSSSTGLAFVVCGTAIGAIGTAIGIALGVVVCVVVRGYGYRLDPKVYLIDRLPISVRVSDIVAIAAVTMLFSILATLIPSLSASRLRPVVGLRHE
jgi:ABC-type lipoprotein release transport system permease subunit